MENNSGGMGLRYRARIFFALPCGGFLQFTKLQERFTAGAGISSTFGKCESIDANAEFQRGLVTPLGSDAKGKEGREI